MKLLETSYLVDYEKGRDSARTYFEDHPNESLTASTISMFELAFGVVRDSCRTLAELREPLTWVEFVELSVEDALEGARVQAELRSASVRIPIPHGMIAGAARNLKCDRRRSRRPLRRRRGTRRREPPSGVAGPEASMHATTRERTTVPNGSSYCYSTVPYAR